ncbi:uncharacterized protein LOC114287966 [Camellia sinensis]|uniref:uncharacterized protein LOC114287966 n=1 Tax=Camellia sinensis TaxID=4442 RepID=UPI001036A980|nr:uncharacterized protein LOC114287966 [Camellia sinensis]
MKDVDCDGNCGFRAIAGLLGLGEDDWVQVRCDLLLELSNHIDEYVILYGSHERVEELTHILSYFQDSLGFDRWMTMPDMGHLIASFYNIVLYHLSLQQCLMFLHLRSPPVAPADHREIAIEFVNGNHFMQVFLEAVIQFLPLLCFGEFTITLVHQNKRMHMLVALKKFKDNIRPNVATRETFDVVDKD